MLPTPYSLLPIPYSLRKEPGIRCQAAATLLFPFVRWYAPRNRSQPQSGWRR